LVSSIYLNSFFHRKLRES
jgi:hypothetical protein